MRVRLVAIYLDPASGREESGLIAALPNTSDDGIAGVLASLVRQQYVAVPDENAHALVIPWHRLLAIRVIRDKS